MPKNPKRKQEFDSLADLLEDRGSEQWLQPHPFRLAAASGMLAATLAESASPSSSAATLALIDKLVRDRIDDEIPGSFLVAGDDASWHLDDHEEASPAETEEFHRLSMELRNQDHLEEIKKIEPLRTQRTLDVSIARDFLDALDGDHFQDVVGYGATGNEGPRYSNLSRWQTDPTQRPSARIKSKADGLLLRMTAEEIDDIYAQVFLSRDCLLKLISLAIHAAITNDSVENGVRTELKSRFRLFAEAIRAREDTLQIGALVITPRIKSLLRFEKSSAELEAQQEARKIDDPGVDEAQDTACFHFAIDPPELFATSKSTRRRDLLRPHLALNEPTPLAARNYDRSITATPCAPWEPALWTSYRCSDLAWPSVLSACSQLLETIAWLVLPEYNIAVDFDDSHQLRRLAKQASESMTQDLIANPASTWSIRNENGALTEHGRLLSFLTQSWWNSANPTVRPQLTSVAVGRALRLAQEASKTREPFVQFPLLMSGVEALLGDKRGDLTNTIATRVATLLEPRPESRRSCKKKVKDLYNQRSRIVHGDKLDAASETVFDLRLMFGSCLGETFRTLEQLEAEEEPATTRSDPDHSSLLERIDCQEYEPGRRPHDDPSRTRHLWTTA